MQWIKRSVIVVGVVLLCAVNPAVSGEFSFNNKDYYFEQAEGFCDGTNDPQGLVKKLILEQVGLPIEIASISFPCEGAAGYGDPLVWGMTGFEKIEPLYGHSQNKYNDIVRALIGETELVRELNNASIKYAQEKSELYRELTEGLDVGATQILWAGETGVIHRTLAQNKVEDEVLLLEVYTLSTVAVNAVIHSYVYLPYEAENTDQLQETLNKLIELSKANYSLNRNDSL
ncbi:hypothetical protein [Kiloniella sp. b19]|uniref:hypothetical protein n=1 Tax=Kiloniella sp. GXU_MW_B19 TaxID=3141326 RepID=UPI0031D88E82